MSLPFIVLQDVTLFDNTILENIRLGRKGATDEVLAAAKLANCENLPKSCRTSGTRTSVKWLRSFGERQRISIARAFLKGCAHHSAGRSHPPPVWTWRT